MNASWRYFLCEIKTAQTVRSFKDKGFRLCDNYNYFTLSCQRKQTIKKAPPKPMPKRGDCPKTRVSQ